MARQVKFPAPTHSSSWRARRYLLLPVLPIMALFAIVLGGIFLNLLPGPIGPLASVVTLGTWATALYHAGRHARAGWVLGVAVFWPAAAAYWIWVALRLDRDWRP